MKCCGIKHADDWNNNEFYNCDRSLNLTNSNKTDGNVILKTGITSNNTLLSNPTSPLTVYCGAPSSCCRSDTDVVITESCGLSAQVSLILIIFLFHQYFYRQRDIMKISMMMAVLPVYLTG